jgi:ABC-2 type transport system permease protein
MMTGFVLPAASLWWRECIRFYRDRIRAVSTFATAILFWILIGFGLSRSFRPAGMPADVDAVEYLYPGTVVFVVLLTAIVGTFSLIEDRRAGFLQGVLVAPVSRGAIVMGKVLGGATIALFQGMMLLPLAPLVGITLTPAGLGLALIALAGLALALTALGFVVAWHMESIQGFHGIVNLVLMPLWFLSGALFPLAGAAPPLRFVMQLDPVTYGLAAFRRALYDGAGTAEIDPLLAWGITAGFAAATLSAAIASARR